MEHLQVIESKARILEWILKSGLTLETEDMLACAGLAAEIRDEVEREIARLELERG